LKNRQALGALRPQRPLIFNFGDLKLRDVAKFCLFQADYDEIELQKISFDVIVIMSPININKITSQIFPF